MLGGDAVGERHRLVQIVGTRMTAPKSRQLAAAVSARGSDLQLALDRRLDRRAEGRIVGDQDRLRRRVVLGLGQQIGGDPVRIVVCRRR